MLQPLTVGLEYSNWTQLNSKLRYVQQVNIEVQNFCSQIGSQLYLSAGDRAGPAEQHDVQNGPHLTDLRRTP